MTTPPIAAKVTMMNSVMAQSARRDERETTNGRPQTSAEGQATAPTLPSELAALSDEALALRITEAQRDITEVQSEQQRRQAQREAALLAEFKERARALGVPYARLAAALGLKLAGAARPSTVQPEATGESASGAKAQDGRNIGGRAVVAPKYRNPADPSQTWTGRGGAPDWIEFGSETLPPRGPGKPVRRVPLPKFLIPDGEA